MDRATGTIDEQDLWRQLARNRSAPAPGDGTTPATDTGRVAIIRAALRNPGLTTGAADRAAALALTRRLDERERMALFPELVALASWAHGGVGTVRELILSLPRPWVVEGIAGVAEPLLRAGTDDEYRRLLQLYSLLDAGLTDELSRRAAEHADSDVREAGEEFLEKCGAMPHRSPERRSGS